MGEREVAGTEHDLREGRKLGALRLDDAFTGLSYDGTRGSAEVHVDEVLAGPESRPAGGTNPLPAANRVGCGRRHRGSAD